MCKLQQTECSNETSTSLWRRRVCSVHATDATRSGRAAQTACRPGPGARSPSRLPRVLSQPRTYGNEGFCRLGTPEGARPGRRLVGGLGPRVRAGAEGYSISRRLPEARAGDPSLCRGRDAQYHVRTIYLLRGPLGAVGVAGLGPAGHPDLVDAAEPHEMTFHALGFGASRTPAAAGGLRRVSGRRRSTARRRTLGAVRRVRVVALNPQAPPRATDPTRRVRVVTPTHQSRRTRRGPTRRVRVVAATPQPPVGGRGHHTTRTSRRFKCPNRQPKAADPTRRVRVVAPTTPSRQAKTTDPTRRVRVVVSTAQSPERRP